MVQDFTALNGQRTPEPYLADASCGDKTLIGIVVYIGDAVFCPDDMAVAGVVDDDIRIAAGVQEPLRGNRPYILAGFSLRARHIPCRLMRPLATP